MLFEKISEDLKNSIKAHEQNKVEAIRLVFSQIKNEAINEGSREEISDEIVLKVLKRRVKQGKDSISQYEKAGRQDLMENEKYQLQIIEKYLPISMSEEDIMKIILKKKEELNILDASKMGILMGSVMKELDGNADGNLVRQMVNKLFT